MCALAACGGDDEVVTDAAPTFDAAPAVDAGATPDAETAPTLDELCNETDGLYIALFGGLFECNSGLLEALAGFSVPTDAELSALCAASVGPFLADGTVVLGDRAAVDACRAFLDSADCSNLTFDAPSPCDGVVIGQVGEGGLCDDGIQCAGARYCSKDATTCGVCTDKLADGRACADGNQCLNGYCREVQDAPDVCDTYAELGEDCASSADCLGNHVCDPATDKCVAAPATWAVDDACSSFVWDCGGPGSTLYCNTGTEKCVEFIATDATCNPAGPGICNVWDADSCKGDPDAETCTAAAVATDPGDACGILQGVVCDAGMLCDNPFNGVCQTLVPLAGDCSGANTTCGFLRSCVDTTPENPDDMTMACQWGSYTGQCSES